MERRHHERIRRRALEAVEAVEASEAPRRQWKKPAAIVAAVLGGCLLVWSFVERAKPGAGAAGGAEEADDPSPNAFVLDDEEVGKFVDAFLAAGSVEELLKMIADPAKSEPRMREFYKPGGRNRLPMGGFPIGMRYADLDGVPVYAVFLDRLFGATSVMPIRISDRRQPQVRWEEVVGWNAVDMGELLETRPEEPHTVRVYGVLDDYYNYDYRDERKWLCLKLSDRWLEKSVFAYIERSNPDAPKLARFTALDTFTVEIKFAPGQERDQAEIVKFRFLGWLDE